MKPKSLWLMLASLAALAGPVGAQNSPSPWDAVAPFIDEQAMLVARADLDRIVPQDIADWLIGLGAPAELVSAGTALAFKPLTALKGAGAHEVYAVVSPVYLPGEPAVVIVPLAAGADAAAIAALLAERLGAAEEIRGAVCAGPKASLERLSRMAPAERPLLQQAFAQDADAAVQVAVTLTADQRRAIEETLPDLPDELGGGPSAVLTRGVLWALAGAAAPPRQSLKCVVQLQSAGAARDLQALLGRALDKLRRQDELRKFIPNCDQVLPSLLPEVAGDRLILSLDAAWFDRHAKEWLRIQLERDAAWAASEESLSNARQVLVACAMYAVDHGGEWPEELKQLVEGGFLASGDLLRNPQRPDLEIGYAYRKPAKDTAPGTVVIYEKHDAWPALGVAVGFCDGAVQRAYGRERFEEMLERGR